MRVTTVASGEIEFDVVSKELVIDAGLHLFDEGLGCPHRTLVPTVDANCG